VQKDKKRTLVDILWLVPAVQYR